MTKSNVKKLRVVPRNNPAELLRYVANMIDEGELKSDTMILVSRTVHCMDDEFYAADIDIFTNGNGTTDPDLVSGILHAAIMKMQMPTELFVDDPI